MCLQLADADAPIMLTPTHDATVNLTALDDNMGLETTVGVIRTEDEHRRAYLQFEVTGLTGTVERATIRLHSVSRPPRGGGVALYPADNFLSGTNTLWTQDAINGNNAPPMRIDTSPVDTLTMQK